MQIFSAVICICTADTNQCSIALLSQVSALGILALIKHISDKTWATENERKTLLYLYSILPVPFTKWLVDWQAQSLKASADILLLWVRSRQSGVSFHTLLYLLFAFSLCFFKLSTIFLPPFKISRSPLNYWLVWSPLRHELVVCCCPSAVAQSFFFFLVKSPNQNENSFQTYLCSESEGMVRITFHCSRNNTPYCT